MNREILEKKTLDFHHHLLLLLLLLLHLLRSLHVAGDSFTSAPPSPSIYTHSCTHTQSKVSETYCKFADLYERGGSPRALQRQLSFVPAAERRPEHGGWGWLGGKAAPLKMTPGDSRTQIMWFGLAQRDVHLHYSLQVGWNAEKRPPPLHTHLFLSNIYSLHTQLHLDGSNIYLNSFVSVSHISHECP